jgi:hypothetical protein
VANCVCVCVCVCRGGGCAVCSLEHATTPAEGKVRGDVVVVVVVVVVLTVWRSETMG